MTMQELREGKGLSRAAMAKALGVTPAAVYHVETGRVNLSPKMAAKVWEVYGVALDMPASAERAPKKLAPKVEYANEIVIQSPMGGEITPEQVVAKLPAGADCVFVRVDQNKLWWIRGEETGSIEIWE